MLFVIICDGTFDQICEGEKSRDREKRDLKRMGFTVKVKPVATWAEAEALEDKMRGR